MQHSAAEKFIENPWAARALLGFLFLVMLLWTWKTWPDPFVDFGRELYVPWRLSEGAVLYRDLAYHNGPFTPYLNAVFFRMFGPNLNILIAVNAAVALLFLAALHQALLRITTPLAAFSGAATALLLFVFGGFSVIGNYNWMAAYSHELPHGVFLSLLVILTFQRGIHSKAWMTGGGILAGCVFLTKCEVFAAVAGSVGLMFLLAAYRVRGSRTKLKILIGNGFIFAASFLLPLLITFLLFRQVLSSRESFLAVLGAWRYVFHSASAQLPFFREGMGTDRPVSNTLRLLLHGAVFALGAAAVFFADRKLLHRAGEHPPRQAVHQTVCVVTAAVVAALLFLVPLGELMIGLPLYVCAAYLAFVSLNRNDSAAASLTLGLCGFALLLLAKIFLNARIYHYGFALALPATVLFVVLLLDWLPAYAGKKGADKSLFLAAGAAVCGFLILSHLNLTASTLRLKEHVFGVPPNAFVTDSRGPFLQQAVLYIRENVPADATLAAMPGWAPVINVETGHRSSIPYTDFNPHQIQVHGEDTILKSMQAAPPDYIIWADAAFTSYAAPYFGVDYARDIYAWIQDNYRVAKEIGPWPFHSSRDNLLLLKYKND